MQSQALFIGVDTAKDELVIAVDGQNTTTAVRNTRSVIRTWLRALPAGSRIGVESSGRYHLLLADLAHARGLTVYVLDPRRVRHYARAIGHRGKTDRSDAQTIARYLASEHLRLRIYQPPTPAQRRVDTLLRRRGRLANMHAALVQMTRALPAASVAARQARTALAQLIATLEHQAQRLLQRDPAQAHLQIRLQTIPGIGPVTSLALTNLFGRIRFPHADQVVAFLGLDPRPCDSGQFRGQRRLTKHGPAEYRRLAYTAAMSARRTSHWESFYTHDRQRGLSTTEALIVLARRLIRTAWALAHHEQDFDPTRLGAPRPQP